MAHAHRALAPAAAVLGAAMMSGCVATPGVATPGVSAPGARVPPVAAAQIPVALYDWRPLIPVPFGTLLKDMPFALTEVLVFHDSAPGERANDDGDCYTPKGLSAPSFLGRKPDDYLLCFNHDHLTRIQASVGVAAADAPALFDAACAQWQRRAATGATGAADCTGTDGNTDFKAHLGAGDAPQAAAVAAPAAEAPAAESATMSITLREHPP